MAKASTDKLDELLGLLADTLTKRIQEDECPASIIKEARELLKDNGIEATDEHAGMQKLGSVVNLPFSADTDAAAEG